VSDQTVYPGIGQLPPEDRRLSPLTGWTRDHWERIADLLLHELRPYATRNHALIILADRKPDKKNWRNEALEGYARSFLLAAYRLGGAAGNAPGDLAAWYVAGLKAGTDPGSEEAWPRIEDCSQAMVEAAFVALALHESRPWIWDRLTDQERSRVVAWLSSAHGKKVWPNNWVLFPVLINAFLKSVGAPYRQEEIDRNLETVDSWYHRDGWYTDGRGANYDYYVGWAIHLFTLLWSRIDTDQSSAARAAVYRDRVHQFLEQYRLLFASNGAPLYHGRSLIYRFATTAPLWAGALLDATPLSPGETRRLASGVLRHFIERGAVRNGVLTLGWYEPFPSMVQYYSTAGSPYWASQAFLGLLLPNTDPVWTNREEPMIVEQRDFCVALPEPGFVVRGTRADGIVRIASHRSDHYPLPLPKPSLYRRATSRIAQAVTGRPSIRPDDAHYRKLAYSSHTAPEVVAASDDFDVDSQITFRHRDGESSRRVRIHPIAVVDCFAASVFYPNEANALEWRIESIRRVRIETVSIGRGPAEIRIHHVSSPSNGRVREGGFAIGAHDQLEASNAEKWALVRDRKGLTSFIAGLHGYAKSGFQRSEGTNPFGRFSATPFLIADPSTSPEAVYVSLVALTGEPLDPRRALDDIGAVEVRGREIVVSCRNHEHFFVQMVAPASVDRSLDGHRICGTVRFARISPTGRMFTFCG
jgi:hypothetical protein